MQRKPPWLLQLEGAAIFLITLVLYSEGHFQWWLYAAGFLMPDCFLLGYLANVRTGAALYNLAHTLAGPAILTTVGVLLPAPQLFPYALIWISHIGFDRMLGYGLKYPTHFKDTHLQRV